MKLLYICEKIDLDLKHRLDQLTAENIETHVLVLPKFTLYKNWEKEVIEPESTLGVFDNTFSTLSLSLKYKKLFDSLERYDSINVYKCVPLCAPYLEKLKNSAKSYFITCSGERIEKNRANTKLFEKANCILFDDEQSLDQFEIEQGFDEKTLLARNAHPILEVIDNLKTEAIEKFKHYLNIEDTKNIVYCDLGANITLQKTFIETLLSLPTEQLRSTTFIFDPVSSTLIDKEQLVEFLKDKRFDYLMPDALLTDEQKAMLIAISQSTIILPNSPHSNALIPSLYAKNHLYSYEKDAQMDFYKKEDIFIDSFDNFVHMLTYNNGSVQLMDELLTKNKHNITKLFHPKETLGNYLEVLKVV